MASTLNRLFAISTLVPLLASGCAFAQRSPNYHLVKKVTLGGEGGWDYFDVDPATHEVLIPRVSQLMVVEPDGSRGPEIGPLHGAHAVTLVPGIHKGFTSNGSQHSLTMFDTETRKVVQDIALPDLNPDGLLFDGKSGYLFAFTGRWEGAKNNWTGMTATAVAPDSGKVVGAVQLPGKPEAAQSDGEGNVYVNIESTDSIVKFDAKALKVLATWSIKPCSGPSGLAIDTANKRLFTACRNRTAAVVDTTNGRVVTTFPIGNGVDAARFDPKTGLFFTSNGEGSITVAHEDTADTMTVVQTIQTVKGARTMAIDLSNHKIFTISADFGPPPAPTPDRPRPGPTPIGKTATLYVYDTK